MPFCDIVDIFQNWKVRKTLELYCGYPEFCYLEVRSVTENGTKMNWNDPCKTCVAPRVAKNMKVKVKLWCPIFDKICDRPDENCFARGDPPGK